VRGVHISAVDGGATTLRMSVLVAALVDLVAWMAPYRSARSPNTSDSSGIPLHSSVRNGLILGIVVFRASISVFT